MSILILALSVCLFLTKILVQNLSEFDAYIKIVVITTLSRIRHVREPKKTQRNQRELRN
ncbi:unnamed protein product, partial [Prunus brigantina]